MRTVLAVLCGAILAAAQIAVSPNGSKAPVDDHLAVSTVPHRTGTGSPNARDNCATAGETYFQTDATAGANSWACTATGTPGTWTLQGTGSVASTSSMLKGNGSGGAIAATGGTDFQAAANFTPVNSHSSSIPYTIPNADNQWLISLTASSSSAAYLPPVGVGGGVSAGWGAWVTCIVSGSGHLCLLQINGTDSSVIYGLGGGGTNFNFSPGQTVWAVTDGSNWYASWWSAPPYLGPTSGSAVQKASSGGLAAAGASDVVALFGSGACSGYLKSDGTCASPTQTIASGALALATSSIAGSGGCQTVTAGSVNSAAATGVATTDTITWTASGSIKGLTGYNPSTAQLQITPYPTAGYVNFDVCNPTSGAIVPGAVTLNWRVVR